MPFNIVRNDITKMEVDVIVNAANTELQMGGGVCGAIFKVAGAAELQAVCDKLAPIKTGEAVITSGFGLLAKHIIHAAGPVYKDGRHSEAELLRACYINSLELATRNECESIAFPLISSGIYGYPKGEALRIATTAIHDFLAEHDMDVYLAVFDKVAFSISKGLLGSVESYIDQHYVDEHFDRHSSRRLLDVERSALFAEEMLSESMPTPAMATPSMARGLDDIVGNLDEPFAQTLLRLIDSRGKTDTEVYKRANIDRRLFSKIRGGKRYVPSKRTVIALAISLELTLAETEDLLKRAGFALSRSQKTDVIIEYFLVNRMFDIFEINEVLFYYDQPLLGG